MCDASRRAWMAVAMSDAPSTAFPAEDGNGILLCLAFRFSLQTQSLRTDFTSFHLTASAWTSQKPTSALADGKKNPQQNRVSHLACDQF